MSEYMTEIAKVLKNECEYSAVTFYVKPKQQRYSIMLSAEKSTNFVDTL